MGGQSKGSRSCTAVEKKNLLSYSSQEFGHGGKTQMWRIMFQMKVDTPIAPTSLCNSSAQRYVPHSPWLMTFLMTHDQFFVFFLDPMWKASQLCVSLGKRAEISKCQTCLLCLFIYLWRPKRKNLVTTSGLTLLCNQRRSCSLEFTNFHCRSQNLSLQLVQRLDLPSVICQKK